MKTRAKRLLVCIYTHNTWGGIETWLAGLSAYLPAHGWEVVVGLARGKRYNDPKLLENAYSSFRTIELDGRSGTPDGRTRAIRRAIAAVRPDVVMPLGLADVYRAVHRARLDGQDVRLAVPLHAINCELLNDVLNAAPIIDLCVGVNPLQETFLLKREAFQPDCVSTIINGVQLPGTQGSLARDREGPLRILFVGRLNQLHKRVLDIAPLVEELYSRRVSFQFTVAGSGEDEAELQRRLQTHADAGRVLFAGYVQPNHLHTGLYPTHDTLITLSPELGEACPLVIQEAMAHGVVPICTNFIGVHSLGFLINGRTGYIYPCGDSMRAADHLTALASDPALLHTMSENCREASRGFALEIAHKRWLDSFEELVERPPCPLPANLGEIDLEPAPGGGRLDRLLSPAGADRARRAFRRWPNLPDGWAEWPGSIGHVDEKTRIRMLAELRELDELAAYSLEAAASLG